jgi:membrane-bound ClpP family serine protease
MKPYILFFLVFIPVIAFGQKTQVMTMEIKATIDPAMKRYVEVAFDHATRIEADIVVCLPMQRKLSMSS